MSMTSNPLVRALLGLEIFQGLKPLQITEILRQAERIVYRPGQTIMTAGTPGDAAVIVVSGDAVILADTSAEPDPVPEGAILAELAMLIDHEIRATVVARGTVRALRIPRAALQAQMQEDAALAEHFVGRIASRLTAIAAELQRIDDALRSIKTVPKVA